MQLPAWLRDAVEEIAAEVPQRDLARAAAELTDAYRSGDFCYAPLDSHARRVAYLVQRLPATYAACTRVFEEIRALAPEFAPKSMLDLGAGPSTATIAAEAFPAIERATLVERDTKLVDLGKQLLHARDAVYRVSSSYVVADLKTLGDEIQVSPSDLIVLSYALAEFPKAQQERLIESIWRVTAKMLVIIEPGTPRGFANVLAARELLAGRGAHILAPCPRADAHPCPMAAANDWCHFAQRVERTSLHRALKGGALGYEDEKFSYVVLSREPLATASSRIVRHPAIRKGHVELQLCTPEGLQRTTIGKSQKERYRAARRANWGDSFPI
jgi:ribosomal protein RSM22 (predicted rRNA methylase)